MTIIVKQPRLDAGDVLRRPFTVAGMDEHVLPTVIKVVSDLLGHSSLAITGDIYGPRLPVARQAIDLLGGLAFLAELRDRRLRTFRRDQPRLTGITTRTDRCSELVGRHRTIARPRSPVCRWIAGRK